jgi:hypothetical protein
LNRNIIIIIVIVFSFSAAISITNLSLAKASNETADIQTAKASINQAFSNVLAAEKAGGNITQLLAKLNTAGALLAEAGNAQKTDNVDNTIALLENSRSIANQVNSDAIILRNSSIRQSQVSTLLTILMSIGASVALTIIMFVMWRRFKHGYDRKLLTLKPEVAQNKS